MSDGVALPEHWCNWCGAWVKYVRVFWTFDDVGGKMRYRWDAIDATPSVADDPNATLIRVPRGMVGGAINYAAPCPEAWRYLEKYRENLYCLHSATCEQRHQWTGKKKAVEYRTLSDEERAWKNGNPELVESLTPKPDSSW